MLKKMLVSHAGSLDMWYLREVGRKKADEEDKWSWPHKQSDKYKPGMARSVSAQPASHEESQSTLPGRARDLIRTVCVTSLLPCEF